MPAALERALIPGSSVVEQAAVNRWVDGSNPSRGANQARGPGATLLGPLHLTRLDRQRANKTSRFPTFPCGERADRRKTRLQASDAGKGARRSLARWAPERDCAPRRPVSGTRSLYHAVAARYSYSSAARTPALQSQSMCELEARYGRLIDATHKRCALYLR